jgi:hypothetical protein
MRKIKIWIVLAAFLILAGCDQRAAEFAKKADELLTEYQKRIDAQIADATAYYQRAAAVSASETRRVTLESLEAERNERTTELEADYRENRKPASRYRTHLREYANEHFDRQKEWLASDLDASAPYLQQLVALESDKATIEAFSKMLKNLAQPRSAIDEIKDMEKFVAATKTEFNKLVCDDIAEQIGKLSKFPADETAAAAKIRTDKLAAERKLKTDNKCP